MTLEEYEKAKKEIFDRADERAKSIKAKYEKNKPSRNLNGWLDGDPFAKELREDSKKTIAELRKLEEEFNISHIKGKPNL